MTPDRLGHGSGTRSPESNGSGSSTPENAQETGVPLSDWLDRVKSTGTADALPKPKGKKEKAALAEFVRELALSAVHGEYKSHNRDEFEGALSKYAQARMRGAGEGAALLSANPDVADADALEFRKVLPKLESKLQSIGAPVPPPEPPAAIEIPPEPEPTPPVPEPQPTEVFEEQQAPRRPLQHKMPDPDPEDLRGHQMPEIEDSDLADRNRRISAENKRTKTTRKAKAKVPKEGAGGEKKQEESGDTARLKQTPEEITAKLGPPEMIGGVPTWPLEDGGAVIYDKLHFDDDTPRAYRIGAGGFHKFPNPFGTQRYDAEQKKFVRPSFDELKRSQEELKKNLVEVWGENGPKLVREEEPKPKTEPDEPPNALETSTSGLPRPDREPTGTINGLSYWRQSRGSVLIEDKENVGKVYRVVRGGFHWSPQDSEKGMSLDREGLFWDGKKFEQMTRKEWRRKDRENEPEQPERPERVGTLQRPRRDPDGEIDDLDYWIEANGSAIIEDERNPRRVYRVEPGGLHWIPPRDLESKKENRRDAQGLEWDAGQWRRVKRSEWGSEGAIAESRPEIVRESVAPAAIRAPAAPAPAPAPELLRTNQVARAEAAAKSVSLELATVLAEPTIGSEPTKTSVEDEAERIKSALRRLATTDPSSFDRARRALTDVSEYSRGAYRRIESEVDEFARREGFPHDEFARILHEPNAYNRLNAVKTQVELNFGFFGSVWNRMTFGLFASARARRIESSSASLRSRMKNVEAETEKRRGILRTLLGIA
jgi:hypothetical protein